MVKLDTFIYRHDCPEGKLVSTQEAEELIKKEGWKDSPADIHKIELKKEEKIEEKKDKKIKKTYKRREDKK